MQCIAEVDQRLRLTFGQSILKFFFVQQIERISFDSIEIATRQIF